MSTFRVKIISPLKATAEDLARRQRRYQEWALPDTVVEVDNLAGGPDALNSAGDILSSAAAIYAQGRLIDRTRWDAILIDCVFDPAVTELQEATGLPTFGPTRTTLPLISLVAPHFTLIARSERQCKLLAEQIDREDYGEHLRATRALGISYAEAKQPELFDAAMLRELRATQQEDDVQAILFGSTTMAISSAMRAAAGGLPLFMPGLQTLRMMEMLWRDELWPNQQR